jgi:hypothetical protein
VDGQQLLVRRVVHEAEGGRCQIFAAQLEGQPLPIQRLSDLPRSVRAGKDVDDQIAGVSEVLDEGLWELRWEARRVPLRAHVFAAAQVATVAVWGTALKPAHEPICVARKPLIGTVAANVLEHGTGALPSWITLAGQQVDPSKLIATGRR